ncbi:hypothetical protein TcWFU_008599 [Taenia crassiceps]|uniref:Ribosome biogenesis protein WDR12 homolog n=1 Tax=Taenia crassiceps TaxID=6207 RepID=A0ABR4QM19_9CEST
MNLHVQVSFCTRDKRYSVPSDPISIPRSSTTDDLENVLRELLQDKVDSASFDFFLHSEFIEGTLDEFLSKKQITLEVIEIEFTVRQGAPEPLSKISHEDFISCVRRRENWYESIKSINYFRSIITGSYDGTVRLQDVKGSEPIFTLSLGERVKTVEWIKKGAVESDDSLFVTGGFAQFIRLWVWNIPKASVQCVAVCRGHKETIMSLASSSSIPGCNADLFASSSFDSTIKVWSADPEKTDLIMETGGVSHKRKSEEKIPVRIPRVTLAGHRNMVSQVSWYSEGVNSTTVPKLISCSWDQSIRLWDVDAGSGSQTAASKCGEARCIMVGSALHDLSVAPQGVLVAASDNKVRIYDLRAKDALAQIGFQSHGGWLTSIAWSPHRADQFVTGSVDKLVKLWDTRRTSAPLFDLMGHQDIVTAVDWAPPDKNGQHYILSASADGTAKVYHYPT